MLQSRSVSAADADQIQTEDHISEIDPQLGTHAHIIFSRMGFSVVLMLSILDIEEADIEARMLKVSFVEESCLFLLENGVE